MKFIKSNLRTPEAISRKNNMWMQPTLLCQYESAWLCEAGDCLPGSMLPCSRVFKDRARITHTFVSNFLNLNRSPVSTLWISRQR